MVLNIMCTQSTLMPVPRLQRWSLRPILYLDRDKFRCFNHRGKHDSTVQLPNFRLVMTWHAACMMPWCVLYIPQTTLNYLYHFYPWGLHKPTEREVPLAILVREGNTLLVKVFAGYMRMILWLLGTMYIGPIMVPRPWISSQLSHTLQVHVHHNFTIGYTIIIS